MKRQPLYWLVAYAKRLMIKPFFIVLLCIFPIIAISVRIYCSKDLPLIQVALYNQGETSLAEETIDILTSLDSTIHFYEASSEDELYHQVKNTSAECGYVFTETYSFDNILTGKNIQDSIITVESPSSMLSGSINEFIFAAHFKSHNRELLTDYLQRPGILEDGQDIDQIIQDATLYFEKYSQSEAIIRPQTLQDGSNPLSKDKLIKQAKEVTNTFLSNTCRGLLSILVLLAALCGGLQITDDRRNGLFAPLAPRRSLLMQLLGILTPAMLITATGMLGILILPSHQPLWRELAGFIFYLPAVTLVTYLLIKITRGGGLYHTFIPLITLGALIFSPVFFDFSDYAKILTIPKYLFINTYYLFIVTGS